MRLSISVLAFGALLPSVVAVKPFPRLKANEYAKSRANAYAERQLRVIRAFTETADPRHPGLPFATLARAKVTCKIHESVCGVAGRKNTREYQCVDTSTALDSCGGCIIPHPFYEPYRATSKGVQCSRLRGVVASSCHDSQCVVLRCRKGFEPSPDGTKCMSMVPADERLIVNTVLSLLQLTGYKSQGQTTKLPPTPLPSSVTGITTSATPIQTQVFTLADAVFQLKNATSTSLINVSTSGSTAFVLHSTLVHSIVQATIDLLASTNASVAFSSIISLVTANAAFATALNSVSTPTPKLNSLLSLLDTVGKASLDLKNTPNLERTLTSVLPFKFGLILADLVGVLIVPGSPLCLESKITEIVQLVLRLQAQTATLPTLQPSIPAVPSPDLPDVRNLLGSVVRGVAQMVGSFGLEDLLKHVEAVVGASTTLEGTLGGCGCAAALGLGEVSKGVGELKERVMELKTFVVASADAGASHGLPVVTNADVLVQALGVKPAGMPLAA